MNILLVGEYSRLHNSLKEGLIDSGHSVVILGFRDGFKDFSVDFPMEKKWDSGFRRKIKSGVFRLTGFDISSYITFKQFRRYQSKLKGFDVVQLINENSFLCTPKFEKKILKFLFKNNKKTFLLSCGDDCANVNYAFAHPEFKSPIQPYLMGKIKDVEFGNVLKFRNASFKQLHDYIYDNISGVIASDLDYRYALENHPKYVGLIPNPVNVDKIEFQPLLIEGKIIIFLGINSESYYKKGLDYFEAALVIIRQKYPNQVDIIATHNLPYDQYIKIYNSAHIVLDQVFANDQGYNALEAMAKGKVVFTGAEIVFENYYSLNEKVNINAVADVEKLVVSMVALIEDKESIIAIGKSARRFVEAEHHYKKITQQYLSLWNV
jgi:hypothetical protein